MKKEPKLSYRPVIGTYILGISHLWISIMYMFPALSKIRYQIIGRVQIVSYIDSQGPWVILAFLITGILLIMSAMLNDPKYLRLSHTLAGAATAGYTFAATYGAFASDPKGPFIVSTFAGTITLIHLAIASTYVIMGKSRRRTS